MHRTGIAPRGDEGACRWIAVRHNEESIHVVAVLARQDGARAHVFRDYPQVRATCLAAEAKYGLAVTAPADKTAATHTIHPRGDGARSPDRACAAGAGLVARAGPARRRRRGEPREFLDRLRVAGVVVRERRDPDGVHGRSA